MLSSDSSQGGGCRLPFPRLPLPVALSPSSVSRLPSLDVICPPFQKLALRFSWEMFANHHDEVAVGLCTHPQLQPKASLREPGTPELVTLHWPTPGILRSRSLSDASRLRTGSRRPHPNSEPPSFGCRLHFPNFLCEGLAYSTSVSGHNRRSRRLPSRMRKVLCPLDVAQHEANGP